jgi:hypothetical protein
MRLNEQELELIELGLKSIKPELTCDGMCQWCFDKDCQKTPKQVDALLKRIEEIR